ncbi:hypothetical protein HHO41_16940 [Bacillus sp. DNRA2]|uniref:hypothetical protein n=1 Tax=Bacillus sp. DNRA2 TaxID=2723053 RepID=UPI00145E43BE|nr:hypothetical protein [Bacillus sp. DNRA2]NMD71988.1 hypothetical protein [Bacillus sp. DNRA2]
MKHNLVGIALLCGILLVNIIFTQYMVHQFFYENYTNALLFGLGNVLLFPVALYVYKWDQKRKA